MIIEESDVESRRTLLRSCLNSTISLNMQLYSTSALVKLSRLDASSLTPIACQARSQNTGKEQATEMKALRDMASYGLGRNSFGRLVKDTRS